MTVTTPTDIAHLYTVHNEGLRARLRRDFSPELADDAASYAWQRLLETEEPIQSVAAWLRTVARQWALNVLKHTGREQNGVECDDVAGPSDNHETLEAVKAALSETNFCEWLVSLATYYGGKTGSDIAAMLEISPATVSRHLASATAKIRDRVS